MVATMWRCEQEVGSSSWDVCNCMHLVRAANVYINNTMALYVSCDSSFDWICNLKWMDWGLGFFCRINSVYHSRVVCPDCPDTKADVPRTPMVHIVWVKMHLLLGTLHSFSGGYCSSKNILLSSNYTQTLPKGTLQCDHISDWQYARILSETILYYPRLVTDIITSPSKIVAANRSAKERWAYIWMFFNALTVMWSTTNMQKFRGKKISPMGQKKKTHTR